MAEVALVKDAPIEAKHASTSSSTGTESPYIAPVLLAIVSASILAVGYLDFAIANPGHEYRKYTFDRERASKFGVVVRVSNDRVLIE